MPRIQTITQTKAVPLPVLPAIVQKNKPYYEIHNFPASSHLASATWFSNGVLYVKFKPTHGTKNTGPYRYLGVRKRLWIGLQNAGSAGKYFHRYIRLSKPYERQ